MVPSCSALRHSSDLRVGGSNPSRRAIFFNDLRPQNLIFFPVVSTFSLQVPILGALFGRRVDHHSSSSVHEKP
jgi:hypothetical protein